MDFEPLSLADHESKPLRWRLDRSRREVEAPVDFNEQQQRVIAHREGPLLVLAGPGTGKTATLAEAVASRLTGEAALPAESILIITFARQAAEELRDRVMRRVGGGQTPVVRTFHSLALGLLAEYGPTGAVPELVTGSEQELWVRDLLGGLAGDPTLVAHLGIASELAETLQSRGLGVEFRNALARAASLGADATELATAAQLAGKPEWQSVALLLGEYLESAASRGRSDYNLLMQQAVALCKTPAVAAQLHSRFKAIYVDEYQDTDPLQIRLLQALTSSSASLIAVGDPDQAIYGFRGASTRAVQDFAEDFAYLSVAPQQVSLRVTHRFGGKLRDLAHAAISNNLIPAGIDPDYRKLATAADGGVATLRYFESAEAEAEAVADHIRRLVLLEGRSWSDVAILVRAGASSIPTLRRALLAAGVPVVTTFDDLPLGQEPAVATLLLALEVVKDLETGKRPEVARELLMSPLCGLDAADLRRLSRLVRDANREEPNWSEVWLANALVDAQATATVDPQLGGEALVKLLALRELLLATHEQAKRGATVHELLFSLWQGTSWSERLAKSVLADNAQSAQASHDLDAVSTLLRHAAQWPAAGSYLGKLGNFIAEVRQLQVNAQERAAVYVPDAVSLLTAHSAKGRQWPVVFVCSADEGAWPDLARRTSLFQPDRLYVERTSAGPQLRIGELPERTEVLAEELRLFYVACTRAEAELHLSSTAGVLDDGRLPSRFLKSIEPFVEVLNHTALVGEDESAAPLPQLSVEALVAQLRRIGTDPSTTAEQRAQAARQIARLAVARDADGHPVVPAADPRSWWAVATSTDNSNPIDPPAQPVYVRGSSLEALRECSLAWFFANRANAREASTNAMVFGNIVHAVAQAMVDGALQEDEVAGKLEGIWHRVPFEATWLSTAELAEAKRCVERFLVWLSQHPGQKSTEAAFKQVITLTRPDGSSESLLLSGRVDFVEVRGDDSVFIADLKTSSGNAPKYEDTEVNPQLGIYQYAANLGLLKGTHAGGAELLFVRKDPTRNDFGAVSRPQAPLPASAPGELNWIETELLDAAAIVRSEEYSPTATDCDRCSFKPLCPLRLEGKLVIS